MSAKANSIAKSFVVSFISSSPRRAEPANYVREEVYVSPRANPVGKGCRSCGDSLLC